jgi:hypothetical protein
MPMNGSQLACCRPALWAGVPSRMKRRFGNEPSLRHWKERGCQPGRSRQERFWQRLAWREESSRAGSDG